MKLFHNIKITVFVKETEDEEQILQTIKQFIPPLNDKERLEIEKEPVKIDETQTMTILKLYIEKDRHIKHSFETIRQLLSPEERRHIIEDDSFIDERGDLFLRFDKIELLKGKGKLTTSGNCFHFRLRPAAYPKSKENSQRIVQQAFD